MKEYAIWVSRRTAGPFCCQDKRPADVSFGAVGHLASVQGTGWWTDAGIHGTIEQVTRMCDGVSDGDPEEMKEQKQKWRYGVWIM